MPCLVWRATPGPHPIVWRHWAVSRDVESLLEPRPRMCHPGCAAIVRQLLSQLLQMAAGSLSEAF